MAQPQAHPESNSERFAFVALVLVVVLVYSFPWTMTMRSSASLLAPSFSSDSYTYLGFTHIFHAFKIAAYDPWYGMSIKPQFGHSLFRQAFVLFGGLRAICHLNDRTTSVVWCMIWTVLICRSLWVLLRDLLNGANALVLSAATAFLLLFGVDSLPAEFAALIHPFSSAARNALTLPFIRMFFPQVAIPLIAFYLLNTSRAWSTNRWKNHWWMASLQFLAFVMFPYATVLMLSFTVIYLLLNCREESSKPRLVRFIVMALESIVLDYSYLLFVGRGDKPDAPVSTIHSIWRWDPNQAGYLLGGTLLLIVAGSIILLLPRLRTSSSTLVAALGLACAGMLAADFLVDPRYLVSHHAGYFVQISLGLEIVLLLHWTAQRVSPGIIFRAVFIGLLCVSLISGIVAAHSTYVSHRAANGRLDSFARALNRLQLKPSDLLIAPADWVDDASAIAPLIADARVLFARNAEILLDDQQRSQHAERQATYLYLSGRDADWLQGAIRQREVPASILSLEDTFQIREPGQRPAVEANVRTRLLPTMAKLQVEKRSRLLESYNRLVILDLVSAPKFDESRIKSLLSISAEGDIDGVHFRICVPR